MNLRTLLFAVLFALSLAAAGPLAWANCSAPAGAPGDIVFNPYYRAMQYCAGNHWRSWAKAQDGADYVPTAMFFDGTNDYFSQATVPSNVADGTQVTGSVWVKRATDNTSDAIFAISSRFFIQGTATGSFEFTGRNSAGTDILRVYTPDNSIPANGQWHHIAFSFNTANTAASRIYINGANQALTFSVNLGGTINFSISNFSIGAFSGGGSPFHGDIADLWIEVGRFVNLDDAAVREKFRSAAGRPVYLGPRGEKPFGVVPQFFFTGAYDTWEINKGIGGGMSNVAWGKRVGLPPDYEGPAGCATIGAVCADGTVYAGRTPDGNIPLMTTAADAPGTYTWNNGSAPPAADVMPGNTCGGEPTFGWHQSCFTGQRNTALLTDLTTAQAPYAAAAYCEQLSAHGYDDWYLPGLAEMQLLHRHRVPIAGFANALYWSSSESDFDGQAMGMDFSGNVTYRGFQNTASRVRCVRKAGCSAPQGIGGDIVYNADARVLQWCDGRTWRAAGPVNPGGAAGGCADPGGSGGDVVYNSSTRHMQYCDGGMWRTVEVSEPCHANAPPGTICRDGSVYAGLSPDGNVPMYTTPADLGFYNWNDGAGSVDTAMVNCTGAQASCYTGAANTALLVGADANSDIAGFQNHEAAHACNDLVAHGKSDWYLPAAQELVVLYNNRLAIGGFTLVGAFPLTYYWSSSEVSGTDAYDVNFDGGGLNGWIGKGGWNLRTRCVRKG